MNSKWKTLSSKTDYKNKWIKVMKNVIRNSENKIQSDFVYVSLNTFVKVIALNTKGEISLINNFRYILQQDFLELPAGSVEEGEDVLAAGLRELKEETGIVAKNIKILGEFYTTNGISDQKGYALLATNLKFGKSSLDTFEEIDPVKFYSVAKIKELIAQNTIKDGPSMTVISMYFSQNGI